MSVLIKNSDDRDPMDPDHRDMTHDDLMHDRAMEHYKNGVLDKRAFTNGSRRRFALSAKARANFDRINWGGKR